MTIISIVLVVVFGLNPADGDYTVNVKDVNDDNNNDNVDNDNDNDNDDDNNVDHNNNDITNDYDKKIIIVIFIKISEVSWHN